MRNVLVLLSVLTLVATGANAALTLPFTDEFNTTADHSWSDYHGEYVASGSPDNIVTLAGQSCLQHDDGSLWAFVYPTDDDGTLADVIVEAWQYLGSDTSGWSRVGVGCRVDGTSYSNARGSGYWVYSDTDADDYFSVGTGLKNWGGLPGARLYGATTCSRDTWHHWAIAIAGNTLRAYSDTEGPYGEIFGVDITTLDVSQQWSSGYVGIGNCLVAPSTYSSFTDRIVIDTFSSVKNWTLY